MDLVKLFRTLLYFLIYSIMSVCGSDSYSNVVSDAYTGVTTWIIIVIVIACLIVIAIIVTIIVCCVCCAQSARRPTPGYIAQPGGQMMFTAASTQPYVPNTGQDMAPGGVNNVYRGDPNYPGHQGSTPNCLNKY